MFPRLLARLAPALGLCLLILSGCGGDSNKVVNPPLSDTRVWTVQKSAAPLTGVWGSSGSDVFAVGAGGVRHYNGSAWSVMSSGTSNGLIGVWGSSGSDVFAVGYGGTIIHYNGSA